MYSGPTSQFKRARFEVRNWLDFRLTIYVRILSKVDFFCEQLFEREIYAVDMDHEDFWQMKNPGVGRPASITSHGRQENTDLEILSPNTFEFRRELNHVMKRPSLSGNFTLVLDDPFVNEIVRFPQSVSSELKNVTLWK